MTSIDDVEKVIQGTPFPSAQTMQAPYEFYRALRAGPPRRLPSGDFVAARRADILEITRRPAEFSNHHSTYDDGFMRAATLEDYANPHGVWGIPTSDAPDHTSKRKAAFDMFKPAAIRRQEPVVRQLVDELIDRIAGRGECEFVSEVAVPIPASVILTLFGLPLEHLPRAKTWIRYEGFGTRWASPENQKAARDAIVDCGNFIREQVLERMERPSDDELSLFVQRYGETRSTLDLPNLVADATSLFLGGTITTAHLIGSLMMMFLQNPDQMDKARRDDESLQRAVEEALRIDSPVQMIPRLAVNDAEVNGVTIPAGSIVLLLWGAANHDEEAFEAPEVFNVERENAREHVAFGYGMHFCIGAPLARLEAKVTFERLFARLANLRLAPGKNDFANEWTPIFRGPRELHLAFDAC
jgi:cytochrome P450